MIIFKVKLWKLLFDNPLPKYCERRIVMKEWCKEYSIRKSLLGFYTIHCAKCILQRQHNIMKVLYCVVEKIALKGSERRMRLLAFFLDGCFLYPRNVYAFESHWPQMFVWILHCKYLNYLVDRTGSHINLKSKRISNVFFGFPRSKTNA